MTSTTQKCMAQLLLLVAVVAIPHGQLMVMVDPDETLGRITLGVGGGLMLISALWQLWLRTIKGAAS